MLRIAHIKLTPCIFSLCFQLLCGFYHYNPSDYRSHQHIHHNNISFALFTGRHTPMYRLHRQSARQNDHPVAERSVTDEHSQFIDRMKKEGNDLECFLGLQHHDCYSHDENRGFRASKGNTSQYLRVLGAASTSVNPFHNAKWYSVALV